MAKKQFKTESKKLLDLMINSIYTNHEIFLRELISNASDALDKRHYLSLTDANYAYDEPLSIYLEVDRENGTLTIEDNGIGMSKEELENNLGVIAHSGSSKFREDLEDNKEVDIIGQFGVGFYSAFMVAQNIKVYSKKFGEDAYKWESSGQDGYTVEPCDKEEMGTRIVLKLREDSEEVTYSDYLDPYRLEGLVKKYSDYIRYPIQMMVQETRLKEKTEDEDSEKADKPQIVDVDGNPIETDDEDNNEYAEDAYETYETLKTLNTMTPLWRRNKKDITEEEYNSFYQSQFYDYEKPMEVIHFSVEGNVSYKALLYIPGRIPSNYYSKDFEPGLQLYTKGVFVMDHCKELLPDYFHFVKGIIDTEDVSLNISREMLQKDAQLQALNKSLTRKIKGTLVTMLTKDREKYEDFFKKFGYSLKVGCYEDYGTHKDDLQDLLLFYSSKEDKYVTLKEYKERMKDDQPSIYYATGSSVEQIKRLPQIETALDKGYEILYLVDDIDEFVIMMMYEYDGKSFQSVQKADFDADTAEEKETKEQLAKDNDTLLKQMKDSLGDKVKEVRISSRLKDDPVCIVADENGISLEMEKYLSKIPNQQQQAKAVKILEVNPNHQIFQVLQKVSETKPEEVADYTDLLYQQALLIEGFQIDDPVGFSNKICQLMAEANN